MAKERIDIGNQGAPAMTGVSALRSELEGAPPVNYFWDEDFGEEDKLALLHFLMDEFGLKHPVVLRGAGSSVAARFLIEQYSRQHTKIDLLYMDADALCDGAAFLTAKLYGLLSQKGIIFIKSSGSVLEPGVIPPEPYEAILVTPILSVYARKGGERPIRSMRYQIDLFCRKLAFERNLKAARSAATNRPSVAVVVLTYMHEDYIAECLRSVLNQQGHFRMRVIIIDDASPDGTAAIVRSMISDVQDDRIEIDFHANQKNVGVVANLATSMGLIAGCDYLTFCEGDDFWSSEYRIQEHIDLLRDRPDAVMSFNSIERCEADGSYRQVFADHANLVGDTITGLQLAENNLIGNFTACFYHGALVDVLPPEMFRLYTVDWLFNLYCTQFGNIVHLKKTLSVYRQHGGGEWSARREQDKAAKLLNHIAEYNAFLDYSYDAGLQEYNRRLYALLDEMYFDSAERLDLVIFDDVFPSSRSGFRYTEFTTYLRSFKNAIVLTSGASLPVLEDTPIKDVIQNYQRRHPELGNRVMTYDKQFPLRLGKLLYMNFLTNAYALLPDMEAANVPFVFTLYPGAGFALNSPECDRKLKRVFGSPCFQKVIVTQQVTYDYIVNRNLCPAEKIQMIFGVVMPEASAGRAYSDKHRWGFGKSRLDICFMAHKYTPYGEDKGYDVFVNVASILRQRHDDIYFHVVGPFDRRVIDVSSFSDRITFHGSLNPDEFDHFFQDMDLIMSPNISGKIFPGSFDGFPTASCTEAGLRGVAIFAVDEFNSAQGRYTDGEDIVLIKYDLAHIVDMVEKYYADPAALKEVGERSSRRIRELYSLDAQMTPRIELLRQVIREPSVMPCEFNALSETPPTMPMAVTARYSSRVMRSLRQSCPEPIKKIYRAWKRNYGS